MAIIANQQVDNNNTNLNSGMNTVGTGTSAGSSGSTGGATTGSGATGGAVTTTGQQAATGQSGGSTAPGSAAPKPAASGQYTNFSNYIQNNQQAGQRLNNLLGSNFQQQGQQIQGKAQDASNQMAQQVQASSNQINQNLGQVNNALTTGDFSSFFNGTPSAAPTQGTQAAPTNATPGTNPATAPPGSAAGAANAAAQATSPVNQGLATWAQNLATGTVGNQQALQSQANDYYNTIQNNLGNLQSQANLLNTQNGVGTLLNQQLGSSGRYGQGVQNLDQALVTGNSANYSNLLNNIGNQVNQSQSALSNAQNAIGGQFAGLQNTAQAAQQQLQGTNGQPGLLQGGLNTLNTNLQQAATTGEAQRQAAQLDILNQFNTDTFSQDVANKLGIGQGASLLNLTKGNGQNYNIANANNLNSYQNSPYLSLNQNNVSQADVINNNQLGEYAALQKMLGHTDPSSYAYTQAGAGPTANAYTLNQNDKGQYVFDQNLAAAYQNLANTGVLQNQGAVGPVLQGYGSNYTNTINLGNILGQANVQQLQNEGNALSNGTSVPGQPMFQALQQPLGSVTANTSVTGGFRDPYGGGYGTQQTFNPYAAQHTNGNSTDQIYNQNLLGIQTGDMSQLAALQQQFANLGIGNTASIAAPPAVAQAPVQLSPGINQLLNG